MKLAIISDNEIYQNTLSQGFLDICTDVRTYTSGETSDEGIDLFILVAEQDNIAQMDKYSEVAESIVIALDPDMDIKQLKQQARSCFEAPVKIGKLVDYVAAYAKQKKKLAALKPIALGTYILNPSLNELSVVEEDKTIKLTEKECEILIYLSQNKGKPVARQALLDHVWGYADNVETHTLETHIYRLRQKLEKDASSPTFLMTNDEGYYLGL